jgi:hypothetical protein
MDTLKTVQRKIRESQGEQTHRAFAKKLGISIGSLARLKNTPQMPRCVLLKKSVAHSASPHLSSWMTRIPTISNAARLFQYYFGFPGRK